MGISIVNPLPVWINTVPRGNKFRENSRLDAMQTKYIAICSSTLSDISIIGGLGGSLGCLTNHIFQLLQMNTTKSASRKGGGGFRRHDDYIKKSLPTISGELRDRARIDVVRPCVVPRGPSS